MPNSRAFRFPRTRFISYSTAHQIKEKNIPARLFEVYQEQRKGLEARKAKYGAIVSVEQLIEAEE